MQWTTVDLNDTQALQIPKLAYIKHGVCQLAESVAIPGNVEAVETDI